MDQDWTPNDYLKLYSYTTYAFYSRYNTVWITTMEMGLDPKNSGILIKVQIRD